MKLLFLYGSPAVGKLTVAKEIAKRTDYKVFHNHLSIDCVEPIFEFGSRPFEKMINLIRFEMVAEAARVEQNLVYTFCYAKDLDDDHLKEVERRVTENGGEVCFVQLICVKEVIKKRVMEESRALHGKIRSVEILEYYFGKYELFKPASGTETLQIDNTDLSAEAAAEAIIDHYGISKSGAG